MEDWKRTSVEEQEDKRKKGAKENFFIKVICIATSITMIAYIFMVIIGIMKLMPISIVKYEDRIAYETKYYERKEEITVKHIQKEKGEEPIYTINGFFIEDVKIPESTYLKYIGEENNTITLRIEEMNVYLATAFWGWSFDKSDSRTVLKIACPWEDSPKPFSKKEVDEVVEAVILSYDESGFFSGGQYSNFVETKFSFECDGILYGAKSSNCLEEGAIKWEKDT